MSQVCLRLALRFLKLPPTPEGAAPPQALLQKSAGLMPFLVANLAVSG